MSLKIALFDFVSSFEVLRLTFVRHFSLQSLNLFPAKQLRAYWYYVEVVSKETLKNDANEVVRLGWWKNFSRKNHNLELHVQHVILTRDCFPIKVAADHNVHVDSCLDFMAEVAPVSAALKSKENRARSIVHYGTDADGLLESLSSHGIYTNMLPTDIGGDISVDPKEWVKKQRMIEKGQNLRPHQNQQEQDETSYEEKSADDILSELEHIEGDYGIFGSR